jgi:hypothetical protein
LSSERKTFQEKYVELPFWGEANYVDWQLIYIIFKP